MGKHPETELVLLPVGRRVTAAGDDVVAEVYDAIVRMRRRAEFEFVLQVGRLVFEKFYRGDVEVLRARGAKDASLRKLAARLKEDGANGMSAIWLQRAVGIWLVELAHGVSARKHLTPRHVAAVLGLPPDRQAQLLAEADEEGLTTRELDARVREIRQAIRRETGDARGRRPAPAFMKSLHHLGTYLFDESAFGDLDSLEDLDVEKVARLHRIAAAGRRRFAELENRLDARLRDLETPARDRRR